MFQEKLCPLVLLTNYEVYAIKIIPLKSFFEYESNGIIFMSYIYHNFFTKFVVKVFLEARNGLVNRYEGVPHMFHTSK
jgi:hypothetical protein